MPRNTYYRGRFMIAIYNLITEGETLLALCDNPREFAMFMKITENDAWVILSNLFSRKTKFVKISGKLRTVEFIEVEK